MNLSKEELVKLATSSKLKPANFYKMSKNELIKFLTGVEVDKCGKARLNQADKLLRRCAANRDKASELASCLVPSIMTPNAPNAPNMPVVDSSQIAYLNNYIDIAVENRMKMSEKSIIDSTISSTMEIIKSQIKKVTENLPNRAMVIQLANDTAMDVARNVSEQTAFDVSERISSSISQKVSDEAIDEITDSVINKSKKAIRSDLDKLFESTKLDFKNDFANEMKSTQKAYSEKSQQEIRQLVTTEFNILIKDSREIFERLLDQAKIDFENTFKIQSDEIKRDHDELFNDVAERFANANVQVTSLAKEIGDVKTDLNEQVQDVNLSISAVAESFTLNKEQLDQLKQQMDEINRTLKNRADRTLKKFEEMEEESIIQTDRVFRLDESLNVLQQDVGQVKIFLSQLEVDQQNFADQTTDRLQSIRTDIDTKSNNSAERFRAFQNHIEESNTKSTTLRNLLASLQEEYVEKTAQIMVDLEAIQTVIRDHTTTITENSLDIQENATKIKANLQFLNSVNQTVLTNFETISLDIIALEERLVQQREEMEQLNTRFNQNVESDSIAIGQLVIQNTRHSDNLIELTENLESLRQIQNTRNQEFNNFSINTNNSLERLSSGREFEPIVQRYFIDATRSYQDAISNMSRRLDQIEPRIQNSIEGVSGRLNDHVLDFQTLLQITEGIQTNVGNALQENRVSIRQMQDALQLEIQDRTRVINSLGNTNERLQILESESVTRNQIDIISQNIVSTLNSQIRERYNELSNVLQDRVENVLDNYSVEFPPEDVESSLLESRLAIEESPPIRLAIEESPQVPELRRSTRKRSSIPETISKTSTSRKRSRK